MIFEDEILEYLYKKSQNGEPTLLNDFLKEKIEVRHEESWKNWSMPFVIAILNGLHKNEQIYFLNKNQINIDDFHSRPIETQLEKLKDTVINVQLKDKGKERVRQEKIYKVSYWANKSSILNVIGSGIIALIVLSLQLRSCVKDDKKEFEENSKQQGRQLIENQAIEQQKQSYMELQNRIRAIEDSLKISHK